MKRVISCLLVKLWCLFQLPLATAVRHLCYLLHSLQRATKQIQNKRRLRLENRRVFISGLGCKKNKTKQKIRLYFISIVKIYESILHVITEIPTDYQQQQESARGIISIEFHVPQLKMLISKCLSIHPSIYFYFISFLCSGWQLSRTMQVSQMYLQLSIRTSNPNV